MMFDKVATSISQPGLILLEAYVFRRVGLSVGFPVVASKALTKLRVCQRGLPLGSKQKYDIYLVPTGTTVSLDAPVFSYLSIPRSHGLLASFRKALMAPTGCFGISAVTTVLFQSPDGSIIPAC